MAIKQTDIERRALLAEYERRQRQKSQVNEQYKPTEKELHLADLIERGDRDFPQQYAFFTDPARRKVGFCTRRAGKTVGCARHILATLLRNPRSSVLYIAQTRDACKLYMWKELRELVTRYELPFEFNENSLWMTHKRGNGTLVLKGADNQSEIDKLRGPKWKLAVLDESSTFGAFMETLVMEVIGPALRDENGTLILIGTAGRKKEGLFYEACHGLKKRKDGTPVYTKHQWSLEDNPYLNEDAKDLDYICEDEGLTRDDPRFLREYMMVWASADSERVWSGFDSERNVSECKLPGGHRWEFMLGMDFGWQDASSIAVVAYSKTCKQVYCMETWQKNHAFSDEIAAKVFEFRAKYGARRQVGDIGGQGKIFQQQLIRDYQLYVEPAKKQEKVTYIEFMNSAFRRGDLLVMTGDQVISELQEVSWNADRTRIGDHEKDNAAMALTYVWRAVMYAGAGKQQLETKRGTLAPNAGIAEKLAAIKIAAKPKAENPWWERNENYSLGSSEPDHAMSFAGRGIPKN